MQDKKGRQGKLPFGKEIKLPQAKHVQILRGLAIQLLNSGLTETEFVNDEEVHYAYDLAGKMSPLKYDPRTFIPQMVRKGYLVIRTKKPDQESYYICATMEQGKALHKKLQKKKAA